MDSVKQTVLADTPATNLNHDTLKSSGVIPYVWLVDVDKKTKTKNPEFKQEYLNVDTLIKASTKYIQTLYLTK